MIPLPAMRAASFATTMTLYSLYQYLARPALLDFMSNNGILGMEPQPETLRTVHDDLEFDWIPWREKEWTWPHFISTITYKNSKPWWDDLPYLVAGEPDVDPDGDGIWDNTDAIKSIEVDMPSIDGRDPYDIGFLTWLNWFKDHEGEIRQYILDNMGNGASVGDFYAFFGFYGNIVNYVEIDIENKKTLDDFPDMDYSVFEGYYSETQIAVIRYRAWRFMDYFYSDPAFYNDQYYIDDILGGLIETSDDWNDIFYPIGWEEGSGYRPSEHLAVCAVVMDCWTDYDWDMLYRDVVHTGYFDPFYENTVHFYEFWWRDFAESGDPEIAGNETGQVQDALKDLTHAYRDFDIGIQSDGRAVLYPSTSDMEFDETDPLDKYIDMFKLYYVSTYTGAYEYAYLNAKEIKIRSLGLEVFQIAVGMVASRIGASIGQNVFSKYYPSAPVQTTEIKLSTSEKILKPVKVIYEFTKECLEELVYEQIATNVALSVGFTKDYANLFGEIVWSLDVVGGVGGQNSFKELQQLRQQYTTLALSNMDMMNSFQESDIGLDYEQYKKAEKAEKGFYKEARSKSFDDLVKDIQIMKFHQNALLQNQKNLQQLRHSSQMRIDIINTIWKNQINHRGFSQEEGENFFSIRYKDINDAYNYKGDMQHKLIEVLLEHGDSWENFLQALKVEVIGQDHLAWVNIRFPNEYSLKIGIINGEVQVSVTDSSGRWLGFRSPGIAETPIGLAKEGGMFEIVDPVDYETILNAAQISNIIKSLLGKSQVDIKMGWARDHFSVIQEFLGKNLAQLIKIQLPRETLIQICREIKPGQGEYGTVQLKSSADGSLITASELFGEDGILKDEEIRPHNYEILQNKITIFNLLDSRLFDLINSGELVPIEGALISYNTFLKLTNSHKTIEEIKTESKEKLKRTLTFAQVNIRALSKLKKYSTMQPSIENVLKVLSKKKIEFKDDYAGKEYWDDLLNIARHIEMFYPGLGISFINCMVPFIQHEGQKIPFSMWVSSTGHTLWNLQFSELESVQGPHLDNFWLDDNNLEYRETGEAILKWINVARKIAPNSVNGFHLPITNYLNSLHHYTTSSSTQSVGRIVDMQRRAYGSLEEALAIDRLTRWFNIGFDLWFMANQQVKNQHGTIVSSMCGRDMTISEKFRTSDDFVNHFMKWHIERRITSDDPAYNLGGRIFVKSAYHSVSDQFATPHIDFWDVSNLNEIYLLNQGLSLRNSENSETFIEFYGEEFLYKRKTSLVEKNGNQPLTKRPYMVNQFIQSRLAIDYEYETFAIDHPKNPFTMAYVIDFWGDIKFDPTKTAAGTLRPRISYEDYISHINNYRNKIMDIKSARDFIGKTARHVLPEMSASAFLDLYYSHSDLRHYVDRAGNSKKGCWADTFIEFNNLDNLLKFQIEFLGKSTDIYKKVKQNDGAHGFNPDNMPTLYVCESVADKLKYLNDRGNIGFNSPILTKAEYFAFMKAWWYAYAEMTNNGEHRENFDFLSFIANLAVKAEDWGISVDMARMVMGSFGYDTNELLEAHRFSGCDVFKWNDFNYGSSSSSIALDFLDYLYMSYYPYQGTSIRFNLWKPTLPLPADPYHH